MNYHSRKTVGSYQKISITSLGFDDKLSRLFAINTIIGDQLSGEKKYKSCLLYLQGNWIEIGKGSWFKRIGSSGCGELELSNTKINNRYGCQ